MLDDEQHTGVIGKRGMGLTLGMGESGSVFPYFMGGRAMAPYVGRELAQKLAKPLIFQWKTAGGKSPMPTPVHGYDVTILIDVCKAIIEASRAGALSKRPQQRIADQAHVILGASAKAGIKGLVYALAGYDATAEEVIAAFKDFVQAEAREYEKEFPDELYAEWYRLYQPPKPERGKPWKFLALTIDHVYEPLAKSNGVILKLTRGQRLQSGKPWRKLHQFLSTIGARALRLHLGQILAIASLSPDRTTYEMHVGNRFKAQLRLGYHANGEARVI